MRDLCKLIRLTIALILAVALGEAQDKPKQQNQSAATVTEGETLWRGRFAHCDYGFYVLLPAGWIGHGDIPPNPNHGFLIGLPAVGTTQPVTSDDERFVFVLAEYNSTEAHSLGAVVDYHLDVTSRHKQGFRVIERRPARLNRRAAIQYKVEYDSPKGRVVEEEVIALRSGIVYEIGIRTTEANYASDKTQFKKILAGFRFWTIHYC